MVTPFKAVVFTAVAICSLVASAALPVARAFADTAPQSANDIPLEIVPTCSDAASSTAFWKVTNKNNGNVAIHWNNVVNAREGDFIATPGTTDKQLVTYYNAADPNNTTRFTYQGVTTQTNATAAQCQTAPTQPVEPVTCVDGNDRSTFSYDWTSRSSVTISVKDNKELCNDVTLYLSSYLMSDAYQGGGFGAPGSYPQTIFDSESVTFTKGANSTVTLTVATPPACKNIQIDLYYAPEITMVGPNGHGTQNIKGDIYPAEGVCETTPPVVTPPTTPGQGEGTTTPATPTTPVVSTPEILDAQTTNSSTTPASLPNTGSNQIFTAFAATIAGLMAIGLTAVSHTRKLSE